MSTKKKIAIIIFAIPVIASILIAVKFCLFLSDIEMPSEAFIEKTVKHEEFKNFIIDEMKVQNLDTIYLFGTYRDKGVSVLRTFDGGASWNAVLINDKSFLSSFFLIEDYAILDNYEQQGATESSIYVSNGDYSEWKFIGSYKHNEGKYFQASRIKDSTQTEHLEFIAGQRNSPHPASFVRHGNALFARGDTSWIVGSMRNQLFFYRLENEKAQLQLKTDFTDDEEIHLSFDDFFVEDKFIAVIVSDDESTLNLNRHSFLFYSVDGGRSWKKEKISPTKIFYRIQLDGDKIVLAYCNSSYFSLTILALPIHSSAQE